MNSINLSAMVRLGWVIILALVLAFPLLYTIDNLNDSKVNIAVAQDDPEAVINELAAQVHIQNLRSGGATRWVGGDLGQLRGTEVGSPAGTVFDNWLFTDLEDENIRVTVEDLSRPTLMNIWASWCGPCRFEFPFLTEYALSGNTTYDLWFLNASDTNNAAAQRFLRTQADGITVFLDPNNQFSARLGLEVLPTTILMNTDGTLLAAHSGIVTETVMEFFSAIAEHPDLGSIDTSTIEPPSLEEILGPINPETATPLVYGQQVVGIITDEEWRVDYRFEGNANEEIIIRMAATEEELDAYLILIGPNGESVAENDDGGETTDSEINMTLPSDGTYVIIATRFLERDGFGEGGFNLQILTPDQVQSTAGVANTLQLDLPVSGRLSRDLSQQNYLVSAVAGETLTFTLTHDLPEEQLNLQVRLGATLRLIPFTRSENGELTAEALVEETGEYSVYVSRSQNSRADPINYTLTVTSDQERTSSTADPVSDDNDTTPPAGGSGTVLTDGASVNGFIDNDNVEQRYSFFGNAGDVVTIEMTAETDGNLDSYLVLLDPDGEELTVNDDASITSVDSAIEAYTLPADGTYTIIATRYGQADGTSSGSFTLTLTGSGGDVPPNNDNTTNPPVSGGTTLIEGVSITATIDDDNVEQQYTFNGNAGDVVTIEMTAGNNGNLDTHLSLLAPDGTEIATNDDIGISNTNSRIEFTLPDNGTYTVVATRYNGSEGTSTGNYTISLTGSGTSTDDTSNPPTNTTTDSNALTDGASVTGTIDDTNFAQEYIFNGNAGDNVVIQMNAAEGSNLDSTLSLLGPDGNEVTSNDDASITTIDSLIEFTLPETGTYTIVATRYDGENGISFGEYTLTLNGSGTGTSTTDTTDNPPTTADADIGYGETINGAISSSSFEQQYTFNGNAGDIITIEMNADTDTELDPLIVLLGPNGEELAFNDDTNDSLNSAIVDFTLPETGAYTIVATRYNQIDGLTEGDFTLTLSSGDAVVTQPPVVEGNTLTYGSSVTGTISDSNYEVLYTFAGIEGDVVTIELTADDSQSLDTTVTLFDPNNNVLTSNDDVDFGGGNFNSAIVDFTLPETGTYTIIATRYNGEEGTSAGGFTLTLTNDGASEPDVIIEPPTSGDSIAYNETVTGVIDSNTFEVAYTFEGESGDVVTIEMSVANSTDNLDTLIVLIDPNGQELASNDDVDLSTTNSAITEITLPDNGIYTVIATRYQGTDGLSSGEFILSISNDSAPPVVDGGTTTPPVSSGNAAASTLDYGDTVTGTINDDNLDDRYVFTGSANDVVTVRMEATDGNLDTYISILNTDGVEIAFNDEDFGAGGSKVSAILSFKLPAGGTYTIVATRYGVYYGSTSGSYDLTLTINE